MSVEYEVYIDNKLYNNFQNAVEEYIKTANLTNGIVKKAENTDKYILFDIGSIRGVIISLEKTFLKNTLNIRLNAFASQHDWEILCSFLVYLKSKCKIKVKEEGLILKGEFLDIETFKGKWQKTVATDYSLINSLLEKENYIKLPLWDIDLIIYKDLFDKLKDDENYKELICEYLKESATRTFFARRAGIIEIQGGKTISVWSYDDVIMPETDYIALSEGEQDSTIFVKTDLFLGSSLIKSVRIPKDKNDSYYFIESLNKDDCNKIYSSFKDISLTIDDIGNGKA